MKTEYESYITNVSGREWAISLQMAGCLDRLLRERNPARVLDMGSGFSSWVIANWAVKSRAEVVIVDDKQKWLDKTAAWLDCYIANQLQSWYTWEEVFEKRSVDIGQFDFICYDMGHLHTRMRALRPAMGMVKPGGVMFMDDLNYRDYHLAAEYIFKQQGWQIEDLHDETLDKLGRYSWLVTKPLEPPEAKKPVVRVIIGIPHERNFMEEGFNDFWRIAQQGFHCIPTAYNRTDVQRNIFGQFLLYNPQFTHLVMLDQDQRHPPDVVQRLARWPLKDWQKYQVVGGFYRRRGPPYDPCVYLVDEDRRLYTKPHWEPGLHQVHMVATGNMIIAREVFERMAPPWFWYDYENAEAHRYNSEDASFCSLCREHHIDLWCDTTVRSPHLIVTEVTDDFFDDYVARHGQEISADGDMTIEPRVLQMMEANKNEDPISEDVQACSRELSAGFRG